MFSDCLRPLADERARQPLFRRVPTQGQVVDVRLASEKLVNQQGGFLNCQRRTDVTSRVACTAMSVCGREHDRWTMTYRRKPIDRVLVRQPITFVRGAANSLSHNLPLDRHP